MNLAVVAGFEDLTNSISLLLEDGVRIIETGPRYFEESNEQELKETAAVLRGSEFTIRSVHAPFGGDNNLSSLDPDERHKAIESHKKIIHAVSLAGVDILVIHPGVFVDDEKLIPEMSSIAVESLSEITATAEQEGVKLALENMLPNYPGGKSEELLQMVESVNSPWLGVCFDTGHAHIGEGMRNAMETLGERIIAIHMQDNDSTRDMHLQPPHGTINWTDFVHVLKDINYNEPITIEAAPWGGVGYREMLDEVDALLQESGLSTATKKFSAISSEDRDALAEMQNTWTRQHNISVTLHCNKCGKPVLCGKKVWACRCTEWQVE